MFQVKVTMANPREASRSFTELFWVDTGALYSYVPEDRLQAIGLIPSATREFVLADGRRDRRLIAPADLTVEGLGETQPCLVVFGPSGSLYLLGATALENFGVEADPSSKTLKPITAVIGSFLASRPASPQS